MNHAGETLPVGFPVDCVTTRPGSENTSRRSLAIVGMHPNGRERVPWDDPSVAVWLLNEAAMKPEKYPRWDALLQIHPPEVYASHHNWVNKDHWIWLQKRHGKPIYMQAVDPRVPDSVRYPLEQVLALTPYRYLRSSVAEALALAIVQGWQHIALYGSELTSNTEYAYQATNYAFWIGFAHGRGIDLNLQCWESEFWQPLYGFDGEVEPLKQADFQERYQMHHDAWKTSENTLWKMKERIEQAMRENKYDLVGQMSLELENAAQAAGEASGAMAEAENYSKRPNPISRQEYERRSAQAQIDYDKALHDQYHAGGKCEYMWNVWRQSGNANALAQLRVFMREKLEFAYDCGARKGIWNENIFYMTQYDAKLTAAGGVRALGSKVQEAVEASHGGTNG